MRRDKTHRDLEALFGLSMLCSMQDERGATLTAQQSMDYRKNSAVHFTSSRFAAVNDVHMTFEVFAFVNLRMNHSSNFIILPNCS